MNKIKYILYITGVLASYDGHSQPTKPNIIVINCDDMGYGDLSCFGSPTIKTTPFLSEYRPDGYRRTKME